MSTKKGRIGSSFDDYLKEQGVFEETRAVAAKRALVWQMQQAMENEGMSKNRMAKAMKTSRSQLDRILDPENESIQLDTLLNAARALGRELRIELV